MLRLLTRVNNGQTSILLLYIYDIQRSRRRRRRGRGRSEGIEFVDEKSRERSSKRGRDIA